MLHLKQNRLILAFPGLGKTPLSLKNTKYRDIDFGTFRKGLGYSKTEDRKLAPIFVNYLQALDEDVKGCVFMSNEPKLAEFVHIDHIYVPNDPVFSARKMKVDSGTIFKWIHGWMRVAKKYNIPITFLEVGLDNYLK